MVQVPIGSVVTPVAFDADGAELYARVGLGPIGLIGGFTYLEPDVTDPLINPDFKTGYVILGADGSPKDVRQCYAKHLKRWKFPEELLRGEEKLLVNFVL